MPAREHTLDKSKVHHKWDKRNPPAIEIESGDSVHFETVEVTNNQVTPGCDAAVLTNIDFAQLYPLAGPVFVKNAKPGDILEVEILRLQTLDWGWTVRGSAEIAAQPTRTAKAVTGMRWIRPPSLSMLRSPVAVSTAPEPKNNRLLKIE